MVLFCSKVDLPLLQDGTFLRSWVAGVHYIQVILAFLAANFVMVLIQSLITLVFMYVVYKVPLHGNLAWILIILILQGFCGMCFGNLQNHVLLAQKKK